MPFHEKLTGVDGVSIGDNIYMMLTVTIGTFLHIIDFVNNHARRLNKRFNAYIIRACNSPITDTSGYCMSVFTYFMGLFSIWYGMDARHLFPMLRIALIIYGFGIAYTGIYLFLGALVERYLVKKPG